MGEEAIIGGASTFTKQGDGYYLHQCKKKGRIVLHHEQMHFYRVEHGHIVNEKAPVSHWEIDPPPGCPWCRDIPDDLIAVVEEVRIREEMKAYAKQQRRKGNAKDKGTV